MEIKIKNQDGKEKLKVVYDGGINSRVDQALRQVLGKLGWTFIGSGVTLLTEERDLTFEKEEKRTL